MKVRIAPVIEGHDDFDDPHYLFIEEDGTPAKVIRFNSWQSAAYAMIALGFGEGVGKAK